MYTYWKFLSQRYLGQKGQGIVEYAVIVAVVVAVGVALTGSTGFQAGITGLYDDLVKRVGKIIPS